MKREGVAVGNLSMSNLKPDLNPSQDDMAAFKDAETEIVEEFGFFDNWQDRYSHLIDLGKSLPAFSNTLKSDQNRVKGCQSNVWFAADMKDGRLYFQATSDALIVSGLIALLLRVYSGREPQTILAVEPEFVKELELQDHLSPTRSNGLASMIKAIKNLAASTYNAA